MHLSSGSLSAYWHPNNLFWREFFRFSQSTVSLTTGLNDTRLAVAQRCPAGTQIRVSSVLLTDLSSLPHHFEAIELSQFCGACDDFFRGGWRRFVAEPQRE